jgi:hypothetical protein
MSERLNVFFTEEATGTPYCLLALKDLDLTAPVMPRLLTALINTLEAQSHTDAPTMGALAAELVSVLSAQARAELQPSTSQWIADLTVTVRRVGEEFRLSCKTQDFAAISPKLAADLANIEASPIETLDGFEGNAAQLRDLVNQVDWSDPLKE